LDLFALRRQTPFHMSETLAEFGVGAAQRLLGIHLHEAREIHQYKKKIAQFVLNLVLRPARAAFAELGALLIKHSPNFGRV
jgi:hypothetical protein